MEFDFSDPKIIAGIIAAITSVLTIIIVKPFIDKRFHRFKLHEDFKSEQQRKIKEVLSHNKVHLLKSCETLNHRLWNLIHYQDGWPYLAKNYRTRHYYLDSFVYRIISVFAWIKIIEDDLIYFDTTISTKEDINMIKFFRLFQETFCELLVFKGKEYDSNYATDHFFKAEFEKIAFELIEEKKVISFSEFQKKMSTENKNIEQMHDYLNGISKVEERLRWDRLQLFHLALIAFLNAYGYDFQQTTTDKIRKLKDFGGGYNLLNNYIELLKRGKLENQKELKKVIKYAT
ncbi:MAG TPA: hypothetical protein ENH85_13545 [Candidatus Scalindua sp.]|nr:hypothetical protein [Candidatus Scalindua sp.]